MNYICALYSAKVSRLFLYDAPVWWDKNQYDFFTHMVFFPPQEQPQGSSTCPLRRQAGRGGAVEEERGLGPPAGAARNERPQAFPRHGKPPEPTGRWGPWRAGARRRRRGPSPRQSAATAPQQRLWHLIGWLGQATGISQSGVELRRLCSPQSLRRQLGALGRRAPGESFPFARPPKASRGFYVVKI